MIEEGAKNGSKSGMVPMAVQLVLGRSGTGKTSYCIKAIVNALLESGEPAAGGLIFLVPEQATYQAERAIQAVPSATSPFRMAP